MVCIGKGRTALITDMDRYAAGGNALEAKSRLSIVKSEELRITKLVSLNPYMVLAQGNDLDKEDCKEKN